MNAADKQGTNNNKTAVRQLEHQTAGNMVEYVLTKPHNFMIIWFFHSHHSNIIVKLLGKNCGHQYNNVHMF